MQEIITMDYGSGGLRTAELIEEILLPAFGNAALNDLGDGPCCLIWKAGLYFPPTVLLSPRGNFRAGTSANWPCAERSTTCAWPEASRCI